MNKNLILFLSILLFLIIEILLYEFAFFYLNIIAKIFIATLFVHFYKTQCKGGIIYTDKIFLTTFVFSFLGEIVFVYQKAEVLKSVLLFLYLIEHQLYIVLLRYVGFQKKNITNLDLLRKGWPYILSAFLFFGFFLMEIVPDSTFVLMIFYVFQFAILGAYSLMLNANFEGKRYVIAGIFVMAASDIISSWYVFLGDFWFAYPIIRTVYIASKFLLVLGFALNRKQAIPDSTNHWGTEDI
jgi:hypothetical protein